MKEERRHWTREEIHEFGSMIDSIKDNYYLLFERLVDEKGCNTCINRYNGRRRCSHKITSIDSCFYRTDDGCKDFQKGSLYRLLHPTSEVAKKELNEKDLFILLFQYPGISSLVLKDVYNVYKYFREKERKDENV